MVDTLIFPRWIIPIEPYNTVLEQHAIAIYEGRIKAILPAEQARQQFQANSNIVLDNHVVMPGLINAHIHSPMVLFRGMADDLELMDWLTNHIWKAEQQWVNETFVYDGARLAILEMLRSGTTSFCDMYFFPNNIAQASAELGMRAVIGGPIIDFETGYAKTVGEYITKACDLAHEWQSHPLVSVALAPHAPYTINDATFVKVAELAETLDTQIHLHLHETKTEIENSLKEFNKRPLKRIADLGVVSDRLIGVHMTQVDCEDIAILQENEAHIITCPESNLKLASGICPVQSLLDAKINVGIGTDGAASNNDLDMFGEMRTAALVGKIVTNDASALKAAEVLRMATLNNARALGLGHEIGSIVPGKWADLIAINLEHINTQPVFNPSSALVYSVNSRQVSDVWIAGKRLLENEQFNNIDIDAILVKAKQWAERFC